MSSSTMSATFRSAVALTAATALVFSGTTIASAQPSTQPSPTATGNSTPSPAFADQETPTPTADQLDFLTERLGPATGEINNALQASAAAEGEIQPAALPIAGAAIAAAAWCASGALGSVPPSVITDIANGGEGVPYVQNAIIGCLVGNVGAWAWKVLPGWAKEKAVAAVAAFIINYIR